MYLLFINLNYTEVIIYGNKKGNKSKHLMIAMQKEVKFNPKQPSY